MLYGLVRPPTVDGDSTPPAVNSARLRSVEIKIEPCRRSASMPACARVSMRRHAIQGRRDS